MIPENGVEDREKLPHHCNEGDLLGSATGSELVVERPGKGNGVGWQSEPPCIARRALTSDHRQWPCGHASDQTESRLIGATPTKGSNLMAADSPEFGQFSEKSPCGHVADARNGSSGAPRLRAKLSGNA